jgi:carboxypeptidase D
LLPAGAYSRQLIEAHPLQTYLGGESYAGQYIPYFGRFLVMGLPKSVLRQAFVANSMLEAGLPRTLKGIAIGNGWIDARRQYPAYLEYGLKHGLVEDGSDVRKIFVPIHVVMLIPCPQHYKRAKSETDGCIARLNRITDKEPVKDTECEDIMGTVAESRNKM